MRNIFGPLDKCISNLDKYMCTLTVPRADQLFTVQLTVVAKYKDKYNCDIAEIDFAIQIKYFQS